jgi:hypothetical protein
MDAGGSFPGVKRPGREADHSPESSAKGKNAWSYTFVLPVYLHDVVLVQRRNSFTFLPSVVFIVMVVVYLQIHLLQMV